MITDEQVQRWVKLTGASSEEARRALEKDEEIREWYAEREHRPLTEEEKKQAEQRIRDAAK